MKKITIVCCALLLTGCTISFQNLDTHGVTDDRDTQTASPDVQIQATVPAAAL